MDAEDEQGGRSRLLATPTLLLAFPQGTGKQGECPSSSELGLHISPAVCGPSVHSLTG